MELKLKIYVDNSKAKKGDNGKPLLINCKPKMPKCWRSTWLSTATQQKTRTKDESQLQNQYTRQKPIKIK